MPKGSPKYSGNSSAHFITPMPFSLCMPTSMDFSFAEADIPLQQRPELDRWILSELNSLIKTWMRITTTMSLPKQAEPFPILWMNTSATGTSGFHAGDSGKETILRIRSPPTRPCTIVSKPSPSLLLRSHLSLQKRSTRDLNSASKKSAAESVHLTAFPTADLQSSTNHSKKEWSLPRKFLQWFYPFVKKPTSASASHSIRS